MKNKNVKNSIKKISSKNLSKKNLIKDEPKQINKDSVDRLLDEKENQYIKFNETRNFKKTFQKTSFNPQEYETTKTILLRKDFKNLSEENEKLNLLNTQTQNMEVNLESLVQARMKSKQQIENHFKMIQQEVHKIKEIMILECKHFKNNLFMIQKDQQNKLNDLDKSLQQRQNELENRISMKFEEVDQFSKSLMDRINQESENRKNELTNTLDQFNDDLKSLNTQICDEEKQRLENYQKLNQNIEESKSKIDDQLQSEIQNRTEDNLEIRDAFFSELNSQKNLCEKMHGNIQSEFKHITTNLQKEIDHRLYQQDQMIDNLVSVVETIKKTFDVLKSVQQLILSKQKIQKLKMVTRDKHIIKEYKKGVIENKLDINTSKQIIQDWKNSNEELSLKVDHFLNRDQAKVMCPHCNVKRWMFCIKCDNLLNPVDQLPQYKFPIDLTIYRHSNELNTKSSCYSLKYFTEECQIYEYPKDQDTIQTIIQDKNTWILYPHKDSVNQKENFQRIK